MIVRDVFSVVIQFWDSYMDLQGGLCRDCADPVWERPERKSFPAVSGKEGGIFIMRGAKRMCFRKKLTGLVFLSLLLLVTFHTCAFAKTKTAKMKYKDGRYTYSGTYNKESYIYLRFRVKHSGVMRVTGYELSKKGKKYGFSIQLYDSDKKRIDRNSTNYVKYPGKIKYYTLYPGTYYFRIRGSSLSKGSTYRLESQFQRVEDQGSLSRDTAADMTLNELYRILFSAGESSDTCRWLKFVTDGEDPLTLMIVPILKNSTQGSFKAYLYGPSYEDGKALEISKTGDIYKLSRTIYSKKNGVVQKRTAGLKPGTYYLKIVRVNDTENDTNYANGYIQVKVK